MGEISDERLAEIAGAIDYRSNTTAVMMSGEARSILTELQRHRAEARQARDEIVHYSFSDRLARPGVCADHGEDEVCANCRVPDPDDGCPYDWRERDLRTAWRDGYARGKVAAFVARPAEPVAVKGLDMLERVELGARNLNAYLKWQLSEESPGYAPTFPSAVAFFRGQFEPWVFEPGAARFEERQKQRRSALVSTPAPGLVEALSDEVRGSIAYALTKRLVIDMPTARAAVDAALASITETGGAK